MTEQELLDAIEWLENDAAYLRRCANKYRTTQNDKGWLADKVEANANHSQKMADELKQQL